jgi:hypothetical protein
MRYRVRKYQVLTLETKDVAMTLVAKLRSDYELILLAPVIDPDRAPSLRVKRQIKKIFTIPYARAAHRNFRLNCNTQLPHARFEVRQGLNDILGNSFAALIVPLKFLITVGFW